MALHRRIIFSKVLTANKTDIEKNEIEIKTYETLNKIAIAEKKIKQFEIIFENQLNEFVLDLAEVNEHYESYLELAKKHQVSDIELKHLLYNANWKSINDNIDEKIIFYKQMAVGIQVYK